MSLFPLCHTLGPMWEKNGRRRTNDNRQWWSDVPWNHNKTIHTTCFGVWVCGCTTLKKHTIKHIISISITITIIIYYKRTYISFIHFVFSSLLPSCLFAIVWVDGRGEAWRLVVFRSMIVRLFVRSFVHSSIRPNLQPWWCRGGGHMVNWEICWKTLCHT